MELKQIKELMAAMERAGIKKASIKEKDGFEVHLERHDEVQSHSSQSSHPVVHPIYQTVPSFEAHHRFPPSMAQEHPSPPVAKEEVKRPGKYITSPMVGTYYASVSPDDPPFVKVGDKIDENTVVCIVEAMKVMNEVKAGMNGEVVEVCVENAHPVEFGTKLFVIS